MDAIINPVQVSVILNDHFMDLSMRFERDSNRVMTLSVVHQHVYSTFRRYLAPKSGYHKGDDSNRRLF